jgi:hypothetical protein
MAIFSMNVRMLNTRSMSSDEPQLTISPEALRYAAAIIADQADDLAIVIEAGDLPDRGGPEALRLLAMMVRFANDDGPTAVIPGSLMPDPSALPRRHADGGRHPRLSLLQQK